MQILHCEQCFKAHSHTSGSESENFVYCLSFFAFTFPFTRCERTLKAHLYQASASASTLRWHLRFCSHWKKLSRSRMGLQPIFMQLLCFQWEQNRKRNRSVDADAWRKQTLKLLNISNEDHDSGVCLTWVSSSITFCFMLLSSARDSASRSLTAISSSAICCCRLLFGVPSPELCRSMCFYNGKEHILKVSQFKVMAKEVKKSSSDRFLSNLSFTILVLVYTEAEADGYWVDVCTCLYRTGSQKWLYYPIGSFDPYFNRCWLVNSVTISFCFCANKYHRRFGID